MTSAAGERFMRRELPTMAEIFAASGYRTGIFGKWHLGDNYPHRPQDRGFQEALWYHLGWGITSTPDYWNNDYFDDFFRHNGRLRTVSGLLHRRLVRRGDALDRRRAREGRAVLLPTSPPTPRTAVLCARRVPQAVPWTCLAKRPASSP